VKVQKLEIIISLKAELLAQVPSQKFTWLSHPLGRGLPSKKLKKLPKIKIIRK